MPISVTLYYEGGHQPCTTCGTSPSFKGVLTIGDGETAELEPRCINCLINRLVHGVSMQSMPKKHRATHLKKKISEKQEREIMDDIGGRTQPASGSRSGYKGDGRLYDRVRMEAKYTTKKTFDLEHADLMKIRGECAGREKPAMVVDFKDKRTGRTKDRWVVIPYEQWKESVNASNDS